MASSTEHRSPASAERRRLLWTTLASVGAHALIFGILLNLERASHDSPSHPKPPITVRLIPRHEAVRPAPVLKAARVDLKSPATDELSHPAKRRSEKRSLETKPTVEPQIAGPVTPPTVGPDDRHPGSVLRGQSAEKSPVALELPALPDGVSAQAPVAAPGDRPPDEIDPETRREILARLQPKAGGGYVYRDTQFSAEIEPDGTVLFDDKRSIHMINPLAYAVDITDLIMRAHGEDPYLAEKRKLMRATSDLRAEMYQQECKVRLDRSVFEIEDRLLSIWRSPASAQDRRRLIFQLWDDCAEDGDEAALRAADMVRATILAFVRKHLGPGSLLAYTNRELEALNRRRSSKTRFAPYPSDAGIDDAGASQSAL